MQSQQLRYDIKQHNYGAYCIMNENFMELQQLVASKAAGHFFSLYQRDLVFKTKQNENIDNDTMVAWKKD